MSTTTVPTTLTRPGEGVRGLHRRGPHLWRASRDDRRTRAYTESFPLFGFDVVDYDELFGEKLDVLLRDPRAAGAVRAARRPVPPHRRRRRPWPGRAAGRGDQPLRRGGDVPEIIDKVLWEHELLGHDRFLAQIGLGGLPFAATARSIELLATEVLPVVRRETSARSKHVA